MNQCGVESGYFQASENADPARRLSSRQQREGWWSLHRLDENSL